MTDGEKWAEKALGKIGAVAVIAGVAPILFFPVAILDGWAVSKVYGWFVVPFFHVQSLPIVYAIGLSLLIRHLTRPHVKDDRKFVEIITGMICSPLFFVGLSWIVTKFL